jgi:uncharacterized protein
MTTLVTSNLAEKRQALEEILRRHSPLMIAYSGGVDSTCLLAVAQATDRCEVVGVIADSPSLPRQALADALKVADDFGATVEVVQTHELDDPDYAANPSNRCYFCKAELFQSMDALAKQRGFSAIAYGENADDPAHLRPGSQAAAEFSVIAPLKEAQLTKADVRTLSAELGLPTSSAPAQPCLSSRIPHGTPVTRKALGLVEQGEAAMRELGFRVFRVRYFEGNPPTARLFASQAELPEAIEREIDIRAALVACGFGDASVDPEGYRGPQ